MNELIEILRGMADMLDGPQNAGNLIVPSIIHRFREAADTIEHLETENAALRKQLAREKSYSEKYEAEANRYTALYEKVFEDFICVLIELEAAKTDISALLWLNGNCEYCRFGLQETYSGANRWTCKLGSGVECRAEWRGLQKEDGGNDD